MKLNILLVCFLVTTAFGDEQSNSSENSTTPTPTEERPEFGDENLKGNFYF